MTKTLLTTAVFEQSATLKCFCD